jgi:hypothetical protein
MELDLHYQVGGHSIRVATINLNQDWSRIHHDLLALVDANHNQSVAA